MTTFGDVNNIWLDTDFPSFFLSVDFCDWLFSRAKRTNHIVCHVNEILTALGCVNMIWHEFWGDFGFFPFLSVFRLFSSVLPGLWGFCFLLWLLSLLFWKSDSCFLVWCSVHDLCCHVRFVFRWDFPISVSFQLFNHLSN